MDIYKMVHGILNRNTKCQNVQTSSVLESAYSGLKKILKIIQYFIMTIHTSYSKNEILFKFVPPLPQELIKWFKKVGRIFVVSNGLGASKTKLMAACILTLDKIRICFKLLQ